MKTWILALALLITGCATGSIQDVLNERDAGGGIRVEYSMPADRAWELARTVFRSGGSDTIEEHREQGYMLTTWPQDFWTAGSIAGAWIQPIDASRTAVIVVTRPRVRTSAVNLTEQEFHRRFAVQSTMPPR